MAQTDKELQHIIRNIETLGWPMKVGRAPDTVVIYAPGNQPPLTVSLKTNNGDGKRETMANLRRVGYFDAWDRHEAMRAKVGQISDREDAQLAEFITAVAEVAHGILDSIPTQPDSPEDTVTDATPATITVTPKPVTDANHFEGVWITTRGPAKDITPSSNGEAVTVSGVEEILLADGRVMYRCTRSARCFYTDAAVRSVVSHLRKHGSVTQARKDDRRFANYSAGAKAGHAARMERLAQLREQGASAALAELGDILGEAAQLAKDLSKIVGDASTEERDAMQALLDESAARVAELEAELQARPAIDPEALAELRAKAQKWDTMRAALAE